jgi:tetratricopeptide (TPR) repeat protein
MLRLNLFGPLSLRDASGIDYTPKARKAQGLLALVATTPTLRRSRGWLKAKLWSDRAEEQASASLRQCLCEIREALGPYVGCLRTEIGWVALDGSRITIDDHPDPRVPDAEFLEGLDVRDPEFEDWLRDQRSARADTRSPSDRHVEAGLPARGFVRPLLLLSPPEAVEPELRLVADGLAELIANDVAHAGNAIVAHALPADLAHRPPGLRVVVRAVTLGGTLFLQVRLLDLREDALIWSGLKEMGHVPQTPFENAPVAQLANQAVCVALDALGRLSECVGEPDRVALIGYEALRYTERLDVADQLKADSLLAEAFQATPLGVYLAKRALLRVVQVVERLAEDEELAIRQAVDFVRQAQALDAHNPTVTAAASRVAVILQGNVQGGLELARRAVEQGPTNPLAWNSLAGALVRAGQAAEAYRAARHLRHLAAGLPQTRLWDMVSCISAAATARVSEAIQFGEIARDLTPNFKPALRYLAALYYHTGRVEEARAQLTALQALERNFSLEGWADSHYPVASMRDTPLIAIAKSGLL